MSHTSFWRSPLDPERIMHTEVTHWREDTAVKRTDQLTMEEPFEIRLGQEPLAVIMRTPGHDHELAMGFLFTEGIIKQADDVIQIDPAQDTDGLPLANIVSIQLRPDIQQSAARPQAAFQRHFAVSSSCGLCGKNSISDLLLSAPPLLSDNLRIAPRTFYVLDQQLRAQQAVFDYTGGLHAAGLFSSTGELQLLREDIGRHNAVDKLIGYGLLHRSYLYDQHILLVSGRTSFEIIQKALLACIPCVVAISAPSSLAVELAATAGITLIGFLRDHSMNVYTHPQRISL